MFSAWFSTVLILSCVQRTEITKDVLSLKCFGYCNALYRRFCQATGYGGTIQRRESVEEKSARHDKDNTVTTREIVVQFNADVANGMPWKFTPTQREVRVKPEESALAFYTVLLKNKSSSSTPIVGVSTYNVTPMKAAIYFNKIQCSCFEEQRVLPGELIDMPVFFYIDLEFESDPRIDGINNIILSYTSRCQKDKRNYKNYLHGVTIMTAQKNTRNDYKLWKPFFSCLVLIWFIYTNFSILVSIITKLA